MENKIIAIDGSSGSGKGTIASHVAKHFGYNYLDTGLYYRAVTYLALKNKVDISDVSSLIDITRNLSLEVMDYRVFVNGEDTNKALREESVTDMVAKIASIKDIRLLINDKIVKDTYNLDVVVDGRDIGTVVFPNAFVKIYLDASVDTRARRRFNQNQASNIDISYEKVLENIKMRDLYDDSREFGALRIAEDAYVVDTTNLTAEEAIKKIINIIEGELL